MTIKREIEEENELVPAIACYATFDNCMVGSI
jgi:hypothetical protein